MSKTLINFNNTYEKLPKEFYRASHPEKFSSPRLLAFNEDLASELGFDSGGLSEKDLALIFSGQKVIKEGGYLSMAYAGHQFGNFVPQLGDGRAMLMGEALSRNGQRYDIQLKGSGPTFFSRNGDGFSALGPVIREYIVSEGMFHLGVPTTRALAAVVTGDRVYRPEAQPGGVFTRVASSHLRIGTFQFFASRNDITNLKLLLDYAVERHYPHIRGEEDLPLNFLKEVTKSQVALVSKWMSLGFIHGVMNTDNMTISGETIDYGPCAFMDHFQADKVFSYIDQHGRYRYSNQPDILIWNLARLADCLIPLLGDDQEAAIEILNEELAKIRDLIQTSLHQRMALKFGFSSDPIRNEIEDQAITSFLELIESQKLDYTMAFRKLSDELAGEEKGEFFSKDEAFQAFMMKWMERLGSANHQVVAQEMNTVNPIYIPRNHQVERAIQHAEDGDLNPFLEMIELMKDPYTEKDSFKAYSTPPLSSEEVINTFCGT